MFAVELLFASAQLLLYQPLFFVLGRKPQPLAFSSRHRRHYFTSKLPPRGTLETWSGGDYFYGEEFLLVFWLVGARTHT